MIFGRSYDVTMTHRLIRQARGIKKQYHRHKYTINIEIDGIVTDAGHIIANDELDKIFTTRVTKVVDNKRLNEILGEGVEPTVENFVIWVWGRIATRILDSVKPKATLKRVLIYQGSFYGEHIA